MKSTCTVSTAKTLKQQKNGRSWLLPFLPLPLPLTDVRALRAWSLVRGCRTDAQNARLSGLGAINR
jgi:hypothetical protein